MRSHTSGSEVERRTAAVPTRTARPREPSNPVASPRSTKEKRQSRTKDTRRTTPRYSCVLGARELMGVLAVVRPLGTLVSLWVLPQASLMDGLPVTAARRSPASGERVPRVIHLTMAQNERKARYILAPDVDWDQFVGGVQERLQLGAISRIETSAGERIMSVADLMHDDHLVIHSDYLMGARGRQLFQQQQPAGQPYEAAAAGEEEAITFDLAPRDEGAFLEEAPTAEGRNGWHLRPERRQATRPGRVGEGRRRRRGRLLPASCCGAGRPRASTCRCRCT